MRTFTYVEPDDDGNTVIVTMTEQEILDSYFPWWSLQMCRVGKEDQISKERCIEDWVVVNWAEEVKWADGVHSGAIKESINEYRNSILKETA